jgi:hypothetical protein
MWTESRTCRYRRPEALRRLTAGMRRAVACNLPWTFQSGQAVRRCAGRRAIETLGLVANLHQPRGWSLISTENLNTLDLTPRSTSKWDPRISQAGRCRRNGEARCSSSAAHAFSYTLIFSSLHCFTLFFCPGDHVSFWHLSLISRMAHRTSILRGRRAMKSNLQWRLWAGIHPCWDSPSIHVLRIRKSGRTMFRLNYKYVKL